MAVGDRPSDKPEWASSGSADKTQPTANREDNGWIYGEAVPNDVFNWWQWNVWRWVEYFDTFINGNQNLIDILEHIGAAVGSDAQSIFTDREPSNDAVVKMYYKNDPNHGTFTTTEIGADYLYTDDGRVRTSASSYNFEDDNGNLADINANNIIVNTDITVVDRANIDVIESVSLSIVDGNGNDGDLSAATISASTGVTTPEVLASSRLQTDGRVETDVLRGDTNNVIDVENDTGGGGGLNVSILEDSGDGEITVRDQNQNGGHGHLYARNTVTGLGDVSAGGGSATFFDEFGLSNIEWNPAGADYYRVTLDKTPATPNLFHASFRPRLGGGSTWQQNNGLTFIAARPGDDLGGVISMNADQFAFGIVTDDNSGRVEAPGDFFMKVVTK